MGNREKKEEPELERSDDNADDVTQLFRKPATDPRLNVGSTPLPDVPKATFQRPEEQKPAGPRTGRLLDLQAAGDSRKTAIASSVGVMLVASLLVGGGIGWAIDKFILKDPPTPWGMVGGLLLGVIVGFYNIARIAARLQDDERNP